MLNKRKGGGDEQKYFERQLTQTSKQNNSPNPGEQRSNDSEDQKYSDDTKGEQYSNEEFGNYIGGEQYSNESEEFSNYIEGEQYSNESEDEEFSNYIEGEQYSNESEDEEFSNDINGEQYSNESEDEEYTNGEQYSNESEDEEYSDDTNGEQYLNEGEQDNNLVAGNLPTSPKGVSDVLDCPAIISGKSSHEDKILVRPVAKNTVTSLAGKFIILIVYVTIILSLYKVQLASVFQCFNYLTSWRDSVSPKYDTIFEHLETISTGVVESLDGIDAPGSFIIEEFTPKLLFVANAIERNQHKPENAREYARYLRSCAKSNEKIGKTIEVLYNSGEEDLKYFKKELNAMATNVLVGESLRGEDIKRVVNKYQSLIDQTSSIIDRLKDAEISINDISETRNEPNQKIDKVLAYIRELGDDRSEYELNDLSRPLEQYKAIINHLIKSNKQIEKTLQTVKELRKSLTEDKGVLSTLVDRCPIELGQDKVAYVSRAAAFIEERAGRFVKKDKNRFPVIAISYQM